MKQIRVATTNPGKLRELREMLAPLGYEVLGVEDFPDFHVVEDGDTFAANAIKKAAALCELTGGPAVADDSGIVVDALAGRPGVHSARYAGVAPPDHDRANRQKLLAEMKNVPADQRSARFVCALAYCRPGHPPQVFEGTLEGTIGYEERGEHGFGYDSIFVVAGDTRTAAEIGPHEKHAISHRGQALRAWLNALG